MAGVDGITIESIAADPEVEAAWPEIHTAAALRKTMHFFPETPGRHCYTYGSDSRNSRNSLQAVREKICAILPETSGGVWRCPGRRFPKLPEFVLSEARFRCAGGAMRCANSANSLPKTMHNGFISCISRPLRGCSRGAGAARFGNDENEDEDKDSAPTATALAPSRGPSR